MIISIGNGYAVNCQGFVLGKAGQILKASASKQGYLRVDINIDGIKKKRLVHRLIATAFVANSEGKPCVNHIDGRPENNHPSNLEWVTQSENQIHAYQMGLQKGFKKPAPMNETVRVAIKEGFYRFHRYSYHVGARKFGRIAEVCEALSIHRTTACRRFSSSKWPSWRRENLRA